MADPQVTGFRRFLALTVAVFLILVLAAGGAGCKKTIEKADTATNSTSSSQNSWNEATDDAIAELVKKQNDLQIQITKNMTTLENAGAGGTVINNYYTNVSGLSWGLISTTGSNLTDITTRNHNDLQNIQGGAANDYQHMTTAQLGELHTAVTVGTANGLSLAGQQLSLAVADSSTTGALSSTDWTTFNSKENALTFSAPLSRATNTVSLNPSGVTSGNYGSATNVSQITVDSYGRITSASNIPIAINMSQVTAGSLAWNRVDKTGSNLTDLPTRNHNDLQNIQGGTSGEYNHLTNAQATALHPAVSVGSPAGGLSITGGQSLTLATADGSTTGALSSTDWTTFNGKENALTFSAPLSRATNTISLNASGVTSGTYGSATNVSQITVDSYGRITLASSPAIAINMSQVTAGSLAWNRVDKTGSNVTDLATHNHNDLDSIDGAGTQHLSTTQVSALHPAVSVGSPAGGLSITGGQSLTLVTADGSTTGALSNTDWNTFSGKENALTFSAPLSRATNTVSLNASGVTSGTYGSATNVPQITVDSYGRITLASNPAIAINMSQVTAGSLAWNRVDKTGSNVTDLATHNHNDLDNIDGAGTQHLSTTQVSALHPAVTTSGTNGLSITSPGQVLSIGLASTSATGALSNTDWNTFSGKQAALTFSNPLLNTSGTISLQYNATNLKLTASALNTIQDIASTSSPTFAGLTSTGAITLNAQNQLRFADSDSSNYVGFQAPATVSTNRIWTLPGTDGTSGQFLSTNGSGTLSWASSSATNAFVNGGNSFDTAAILGTNDSNDLSFETGGTTRATFNTTNGLYFPNGIAMTSNAGNHISITTGTSGNLFLDTGTTGSIGLGNTSNAKSIYIGNNTGATAVNINTGTGGLTVNTGTGDLAINTDDLFVDQSNSRVGIGTASPSAKLHVLSSTELLRLGHDSSNYWAGTVSSSGGLTLAGTAAGGLSMTTGTTGALALDTGTTGAINFGTGANAKVITFGNTGVGTTFVYNSGATGAAVGTQPVTYNLNSVTTGNAYVINSTGLTTNGSAFRVTGPTDSNSDNNLINVAYGNTGVLDQARVTIGGGASGRPATQQDQLYVYGRINSSWQMYWEDFLGRQGTTAVTSGAFKNLAFTRSTSSGDIDVVATAGVSGAALITSGTTSTASQFFGTGGVNVTQTSLNPVFETNIQGSSSSSHRIIAGFSNTNGTSALSDANLSDEEIFFRKRANSDDVWETVTRSAGSETTNSTTVSPSAFHKLRIEVQNTGTCRALFYINGILVATHTTNVPAATDTYGFYVGQATSSSSSSKNLYIDYLRVWSDDPVQIVSDDAGAVETEATAVETIDVTAGDGIMSTQVEPGIELLDGSVGDVADVLQDTADNPGATATEGLSLATLETAVGEQKGNIEKINAQLADFGLRLDTISATLQEHADRIQGLEEKYSELETKYEQLLGLIGGQTNAVVPGRAAKYLGVFEKPPDNTFVLDDLTGLLAGDTYKNTLDGKIYFYDGEAWNALN